MQSLRTTAFALTPACLWFFGAFPAVRAADPEPLYKTKYRVINIHRHCAVATEAAARAELEVMDRVGMSVVTILDGDSPAGNLDAWIQLQEKFPDRLVVFWKPSFAKVKEATFFTDLVRDLDRAAKRGVRGVKIWKDLGMYVRDSHDILLRSDDSRLDPFWEKCGELGLPVLIHVADEREYWYPLTPNSIHSGLRAEQDQHYNNPAMPTWEELIRQRDGILKAHPKATFIGAHMGSLSLDLKRLGETFDKYPNFYVDTSARQRILGRLNPPAIRDFFVKYQDRILFGTDDFVLSKGRNRPAGGNFVLYPNDDPAWLTVDPTDAPAVTRWKDRAAFDYAQYLQYFETDRLDLADPNRSGGAWFRMPGVKLPPGVLEKLYHTNAEKLIPGLAGKGKP